MRRTVFVSDADIAEALEYLGGDWTEQSLKVAINRLAQSNVAEGVVQEVAPNVYMVVMDFDERQGSKGASPTRKEAWLIVRRGGNVRLISPLIQP